MTPEEIAAVLGCQTVEQLADECGFAPEDRGVVVAALSREMVRPTLVLDFRGRQPGWPARGGELGAARLPRRLDPRTGLYWEPERRRRGK